MKKSVVALLHAGFWFSYFLLGVVIIGAIYGSRGSIPEAKVANAFLIIVFFIFIPSAISFYSFYFVLFPRYLQKSKIWQAIVFGLFIAIGAALIGNIIFGMTTIDFDCGSDDTWVTFFGSTAFISFIALINGVIALVLRGFITWYDEIKITEQLKQKNHEMELSLVKAQLDPHFLFNTINNIDVLIVKNAENASAYLNKLSDIMRFMLFETKTDNVLLSKEIIYIEKYIELQKIRTANSNYINYSVKGDPEGMSIAPMVFIPFIENAFKHTINKKIDNAINIEIIISDSSTTLICENKYDSNRQLKQENNGLGNELIQKRLNLIYPNRHTLKVINENDVYHVHLTINHG
jgi:hypothetical protein